MTPTREGERVDRGSVLAVVLVLMLALELLAHGALLMARQEAEASRAGARVLQARLAADHGLLDVGAPLGAALGGTPLQGVVEMGHGTLGNGRYRRRLRRLTRERWLAESEGWVRGVGWRIREAALAWLPDPVERLRAFGGVIVVGSDAPVALDGPIEVGGVRRDGGAPDTPACVPWRAALDSLYAAGLPEPVARAATSPVGEPSLGPLGPEELLGWLAVPGGGPGGGPGGPPGGPRAVRGDLTLRGESGEGLLVVEGDLELVGGSHEGLLIVGGRLTLRDGAALVGFARAAGGVRVASDARVVGSGCRALRALGEEAEGWVRPFIRASRAFPFP